MMSTRANIIISECKVPLSEDKDKIILYHHCDGYPGGVGEELVDFLRKFSKKLSELNDIQSNSMMQSYDWSPVSIAEFITDRDMLYRRVIGVTEASEYIYIIDTTKKRLSCHATDGCIDLDCLGDRIEIEGNVFDGRQTELKIEPDFSKMFQACSVVSEIKDGNVIFTNGTSMPLSQILETNLSVVNDTPNIGVTMHDPPFPAPKPDRLKPLYVQIDEKLELYKKIFLIVLPIILRRESHPFNYKLIMEQANDLTVNTMRQFSKMREYYSEHI